MEKRDVEKADSNNAMGTGKVALPSAVEIGRWWFQRRSLSPLPWFLLLVVLPAEFLPSPTISAAAIAVVLLSEALRIWAVGFAGSATRTRGDVVPALVHAGPYRFLRNPLYLANIAMYTAAGVAFGFRYLSLAIFLYSAIQYSFIIRYEETLLAKTFGEPYRKFLDQVPRWFGLRPAMASSGHTFDLQKALRSERSTFFSMALMALLFILKGAITGK